MAEKTKAWQQNRWIDCNLEDVTDDEIKRALMHASSQANFHFKTMGLIGRNGSLKIASYFKQHFSLIFIQKTTIPRMSSSTVHFNQPLCIDATGVQTDS